MSDCYKISEAPYVALGLEGGAYFSKVRPTDNPFHSGGTIRMRTILRIYGLRAVSRPVIMTFEPRRRVNFLSR